MIAIVVGRHISANSSGFRAARLWRVNRHSSLIGLGKKVV